MKEVIGVIPARYRSTRFPGKLLACLHNSKSILQEVYERANKSKYLDDLLIAVDNSPIKEEAERFAPKSKVIITSDKHSCGTERIIEVISKLKLNYKIIINIQADEPMLDPSFIDKLAEAILKNKKVTMMTLATSLAPEDHQNTNVVKVVCNAKGEVLDFTRYLFKELPYTYRHVGVYAYRREFLLQFNKLTPTPVEELLHLEQFRPLQHGYKISIVKVDYKWWGIDTPEDLERLKSALEKEEINEKR